MSRSGYSDNCANLNLYRGAVDRAINGNRGQAFLRELADAMDAMPDKILIEGELVNSDGACCTIGVVCKARNIDVSKIDASEAGQVGGSVGIATAMAAEIEYENDEVALGSETPAERWLRMRSWVAKKLINVLEKGMDRER